MSDNFARANYQCVSGPAVRYKLYPVIAGSGVSGIAITTGAGAWGAWIELIAAALIATPYWVCGLCYHTLAGGAIQVMEMQVGGPAGAPVIGETVFDPSLVTPNVGYIPIGPYPVQMAGGSQLMARGGGAAARGLTTSALIATGLA